MNNMTQKLPPQSTLLRELDYNPDTGEFRWRNPHARRGRREGVIGTVQCNGGLSAVIDGKTYMLHALAWKMIHDEEPKRVFHINGNPADNRLANLTARRVSVKSAGRYSEYIGYNRRRKKWYVLAEEKREYFACRICAEYHLKKVNAKQLTGM